MNNPIDADAELGEIYAPEIANLRFNGTLKIVLGQRKAITPEEWEALELGPVNGVEIKRP